MLYLVTFTDGSQGVFTGEQLADMLLFMWWQILSYEPYGEPVPEPEPEPEPPPPPARPPPCSISIDAPDSAQEGETVVVLTTITNNSPYAEVYKYEIFAGADLIGSTFDTIPAGATKSYYAAFIMPGADVTVFVWMEVWYPDTETWNYNNAATRLVSLEIPAATYHLSVHVPAWAAGGYIDPGSGDYPAYSTVMLTAYPLDGYQFTGWGGAASGTNPTYALYMDGDKYVEAYFEPVEVEVPEPEFRQFRVLEYTKR